jgi:nickel/cobalt transporter (NiCoT) family protein
LKAPRTNGGSAGRLARIAALYAIIIAATVAGFGLSVMIGRSYLVLTGLGLVALLFGLRHGVDADHIAAIDNTTRKLIQDGKRPITVGLWFSLGHSTVVFALIVVMVYAARATVQTIPALQSMGSVVGTTISAVFLGVIGAINLFVAIDVYSILKGRRAGEIDESHLEEALQKRGLMARILRRFLRAVKEPWQTYPIGLLFGLGFDTATEIALIAISIGVGVSAVIPPWMILVLPLMFTCGMTMVDYTDGVMMSMAYGWAFLTPSRKLFYNLSMTLTSVLVAFIIGGVELLQVVQSTLDIKALGWLAGLDFETAGFGIVALTGTIWLGAILLYRRSMRTPARSA